MVASSLEHKFISYYFKQNTLVMVGTVNSTEKDTLFVSTSISYIIRTLDMGKMFYK